MTTTAKPATATRNDQDKNTTIINHSNKNCQPQTINPQPQEPPNAATRITNHPKNRQAKQMNNQPNASGRKRS